MSDAALLVSVILSSFIAGALIALVKNAQDS